MEDKGSVASLTGDNCATSEGRYQTEQERKKKVRNVETGFCLTPQQTREGRELE